MKKPKSQTVYLDKISLDYLPDHTETKIHTSIAGVSSDLHEVGVARCTLVFKSWAKKPKPISQWQNTIHADEVDKEILKDVEKEIKELLKYKSKLKKSIAQTAKSKKNKK